MKASHREDNRQDRQRDILTDEENGLRIIVSRLGAELISLARVNEAANGLAFLTGTTICPRHIEDGQTMPVIADIFSHRQLSLWRNAGLRFFWWGNAVSPK